MAGLSILNLEAVPAAIRCAPGAGFLTGDRSALGRHVFEDASCGAGGVDRGCGHAGAFAEAHPHRSIAESYFRTLG